MGILDPNFKFRLYENLQESLEEIVRDRLKGFAGMNSDDFDILWAGIRSSPVHASRKREQIRKSFIESRKKITSHAVEMNADPSVDGVPIHHPKTGEHIFTFPEKFTEAPYDPPEFKVSNYHPDQPDEYDREEKFREYWRDHTERNRGSRIPGRYTDSGSDKEEIKNRVNAEHREWTVKFNDALAKHRDFLKRDMKTHQENQKVRRMKHFRNIIGIIESGGKERDGSPMKLKNADGQPIRDRHGNHMVIDDETARKIQTHPLHEKKKLLDQESKYTDIRMRKFPLGSREQRLRTIGDFIGGALNPSYAIHDEDPFSRKLGHWVVHKIGGGPPTLGPRGGDTISAPVDDIASEHAPR